MPTKGDYPDFFNTEYLKSGSAIQQKGYDVLTEVAILQHLSSFDAVLAGTLPLDLFTDNSDLDVLCYALDLSAFAIEVTRRFEKQKGFHITRLSINGEPTVLSTFAYKEFQFEIFGQSIPVRQQAGFCHMIVEWHVLQARGKIFKDQVLALKKSGVKTEPAFARLLQLTGDPYQALLQYEVK